jgi:hypothetical protein
MHAQKVRAMFDKGQKGRAGHWVRMALHVARTRRARMALRDRAGRAWHCMSRGREGRSSTDMSQGRTWSAPAAQQRTLGTSASSRVTTTRDVFSPRLVGVASSDAPHISIGCVFRIARTRFSFEFHVCLCPNMHKRIEEGCLTGTAGLLLAASRASSPRRTRRTHQTSARARRRRRGCHGAPARNTRPTPAPE